MDLKQLRERGAFVAPPVPMEVTWVHRDAETGEEHRDTFTVHIRQVSVGWFERLRSMPSSGEARSRLATLISEGVLFGEGGAEQMKYEEAYRLNIGLANALLVAFNKVNNSEEESGDPKG